MNDPIASGPPEASTRASVFRTAEADAQTAVLDIEEAIKRAVAGIERWYAEHFHRAAVAGRVPLPADQQAALVAHVTAAINPVKE